MFQKYFGTFSFWAYNNSHITYVKICRNCPAHLQRLLLVSIVTFICKNRAFCCGFFYNRVSAQVMRVVQHHALSSFKMQ